MDESWNHLLRPIVCRFLLSSGLKMDESWNHLQNLEAHIKEHNTHIEKLTPLRTRHHSRQSSLGDEALKRPIDSSVQGKMLSMAKEVKDKEREILYLKRDVASLEIYKDQCMNMQTQIKLLREKAVFCEREALSKSTMLSSFESNAFPKLEKLESDLKQALQSNEKLQKSYLQAKKETEEKIAALTNLKTTYSNQDSTIKSIEEERRNLKIKHAELQGKFDEMAKQHEKTLEHYKNKDQLALALEEDNERLRAQIENTMESLQKCQYELNLLPKLKQEIHQREQLISAASREIEKEKALKIKAIEDKEKTELQLANIFECTDGNNPLEYIQGLKVLLNKTAKEQSNANEDILRLKEKQRNTFIENSQNLEYISEYLESVSKTVADDFMSMRGIKFPEINIDYKPVLHGLCEQIEKVQMKCKEKIIEIQDTNQILNEKISKYEKGFSLRQRIEEMEKLIQQQEILSEQLTSENTRIKKELELCNKELHSSEVEKQQLLEELETMEEQKLTTETKLEEMHIELEEICKDHEKLKTNILNKDELNAALEENNEKLRRQIETVMESLEKCQKELNYIPKIKQDINSKEQMLQAGTKELERLKYEMSTKDKLLKDVSKDLNELHKEISLREQAYNALNREMDKLKLEFDSRENMNDELVSKLEKKKKTMKELVVREENLSKQLAVIQKLTENKSPAEYIEELKISKESLATVLIPKLKGEIDQRDQTIKALNQKYTELKEKTLKEQNMLIEICEGKNSEVYISELKTSLAKTIKDLAKVHEDNAFVRDKLKKLDAESSHTSGYISSYLKGISKYLTEEFFIIESLSFPKIEEPYKQILMPLCESLGKLKKLCSEKIAEPKTPNESSGSNKKTPKNDENLSHSPDISSKILNKARVKIEENEGLLIKQENLLNQLSSENFRIKKELEITKEELIRTEKERQKLSEKNKILSENKDEDDSGLEDQLQIIQGEYEKALEQLKIKDQEIMELESINIRFREQVHTTMASLEECQIELNRFSKIKQEVQAKEQQLQAALQELEKLRSKNKEQMKKIEKLQKKLESITQSAKSSDSLELQDPQSTKSRLKTLEKYLSELYKATDNEDPLSFIQDLKSSSNK
ncbi:hypothetical protein SteCoe_16410 [Stentor coeruleus]|uniref:Uncharacterized protein n=1 Tax=Stentor coeruleus TaxID=5963 RepID=A0A1R2C193_9CILI|nr:hypothetical protein SteCoe_16410 [Stentor coeruleus]